LSSKIIKPPTRPIRSPIEWSLSIFFLQMSATSKNVIIGLKEVIMTLPAPAKPALTAKKEETIKAILKKELPKIYFKEFLLREMGFLKK